MTPALLCPSCLGATPEGGPRAWACPGCGATYRGLRGVPDLRKTEDDYLPPGGDWDRAVALDDAFDRLDFRGLLDLFFDLAPEVDAASRRVQVGHILSAPDRALGWLDALGPLATWGPLLDLGCGSGSFLASAAAPGRSMIGIDVAMRWLLVARKRLDEEGLAHVPLVCGRAESLPFAPATFSGVVAGDVIEHVADQPRTLAEAHRVLIPGGRLFLAAPNRFSLTPEPHVGVWGVGFLPRSWMSSYVRRMSGRDFRDVRTLGKGEWRRLIERSPFENARLFAPRLPESDLVRFSPIKRRLGRAYNRAIAHPAGQAVARAIGPLFHVVCERPRAMSARGESGKRELTCSEAKGLSLFSRE